MSQLLFQLAIGRVSNVEDISSDTAPPGPPKNVAVAIVTHNSITLTWSCTTGTGVFYQVCYLTSDSEGHTCYRVDSNECNVTHTITGLEPVTTYSIDVCSNNMVSDQDPNKHLRVVEVVASTTEGGMYTQL